jgi:hypothetical protein
MEAIREALYDILEVDNPATDRGTFYQAVWRGVVAKTEQEYKGTVVRLLSEMRREGVLPFDWLADNTRWMRKPRTYTSLAAALDATARFYRRSLWADAEEYVEIWIEKDALAGVIYPVTEEYDVPLMVSLGYASLTFLHSADESIEAQGKPAYIYYLGDYDPSGIHIPQRIEADLRTFAPDAEIHFERVAVTSDQIREWNLPTRPTKQSDSRSKGFDGESVELDAIPAGKLRDLVRDCIEWHIDPEHLRQLELAEQSERQILLTLAQKGGAS